MLFEKKSSLDSVNQIISGLGNLMSAGQNNAGGGLDLSMVGSVLSLLDTMNNAGQTKENNVKEHKELKKDKRHQEQYGLDWDNIISMGSAFFQQSSKNDMVMGLVPMMLEALGHASNDDDAGNRDHSGHSWFLPPILENIHVMWDHFRYCKICHKIRNFNFTLTQN